MKKVLVGLVSVFALASLSACPGSGSQVAQGGGSISSNPTVSSTVMSAEQLLTLLERTADVYFKLPRCGPGAPTLCSDPVLVRKIRGLDIQAYNAVMAARANEALAGAALAAVNALKAVVPNV